jgi:dinuclear metal center YbgI/SA1388 family protein
VEASARVARIASGTTASAALIEAAAEWGADVLLVHHGFFWKGEPPALVGIKGHRVAALFRHRLSLLAYHLPLDAHPQLGNNRQLGLRLGFTAAGAQEETQGLLWRADIDPMDPADLADRITRALQRAPLHVAGGSGPLRRIMWCTGAAAGYLDQAAALGCDAFITGEIPEHAVHMARELGVHLFAAGHHATERYGVQALGEELAGQFAIEHRHIEIESPV